MQNIALFDLNRDKFRKIRIILRLEILKTNAKYDNLDIDEVKRTELCYREGSQFDLSGT